MTDTNEQLERESLLLRVFWMLAFTLAWYLAEVVLAVVVILQLGCRLLLGIPHPELLRLGDGLSQYLAQIGRFGSFNTEEKPWPFSDWPAYAPEQGPSAESESSKDGSEK